MIRNWFRTRRALVAMLDDRGDIIAKQIDEIAKLREDNDSIWFDVQVQTRQQMQVLDHTRKLLDAHEQKNARLVAELKALRDDLHRAENGGNLPSATGPGMARVANRPLVWQAQDAIDQDAAAKRQADGLGDPA